MTEHHFSRNTEGGSLRVVGFLLTIIEKGRSTWLGAREQEEIGGNAVGNIGVRERGATMRAGDQCGNTEHWEV